MAADYPGKPGQVAVHRSGGVAVLSHRKTEKESIHPGWWCHGRGGLADFVLNGPDWVLIDELNGARLFRILTEEADRG